MLMVRLGNNQQRRLTAGVTRPNRRPAAHKTRKRNEQVETALTCWTVERWSHQMAVVWCPRSQPNNWMPIESCHARFELPSSSFFCSSCSTSCGQLLPGMRRPPRSPGHRLVVPDLFLSAFIAFIIDHVIIQTSIRMTSASRRLPDDRLLTAVHSSDSEDGAHGTRRIRHHRHWPNDGVTANSGGGPRRVPIDGPHTCGDAASAGGGGGDLAAGKKQSG